MHLSSPAGKGRAFSMTLRFRSVRRGFTLLEMLIVIVILAILVGLIVPMISRATVSANTAKCASNLRQIGTGLMLYSAENAGFFPPTTHTTGSRRIEESWIYGIAEYLDNVDQVRVCPADPAKRRKRIIEQRASSYALNDLIFDNPEYHQAYRIPNRSHTFMAFILSENRAASRTWDHVHAEEWSAWNYALNDVEVDRHRVGARAEDRLKGSANYLFADGHVENIRAEEFKSFFDRGINPAEVGQVP